VKRLPLSVILLAALWWPALSSPQPLVICTADLPSVPPEGAVSVHILAKSQGPLKFDWHTTGGSIKGTGTQVEWIFKDAFPGIYRATVRVRGSDLDETCMLRMVVTQPDRGGPQVESGKGFLPSGEKETPGFGLYSYLLMGAPPIESTHARYVKVIEAYLKLLPAIEALKRNIRAKEINAAYLPVDMKAPREMSTAWILAHYDYARARALLRLIPGNLRQGPYFVSSLTPLSGKTAMPDQYLFQNLSSIPATPNDLAAWWVRAFMNQAAQERFWDANAGYRLALKMRTVLAILSVGLPDVRQSLNEWIAWVK
jgi:hypothetical protein